MNSEKVKEIKECLQSCNDDKMACYDCKYYEKCEKILTKNNILTLINELESENERLKILLAQANAGIVNCSGCKLVEINAVREFAKEVKECKTIKELVELGYIASYVDVCKDIDELLKEYEK